MKEREYHTKINSIEAGKRFAVGHKFDLIFSAEQNITIFRNENKTMARITENTCSSWTSTILDFKEDKLGESPLSIRRESKAMEISDMEATLSILDFLGYKKDNTLRRNRWVYTKGDITIEIDEYLEPEASFVLSIEGNDYDAVDVLYHEISNGKF